VSAGSGLLICLHVVHQKHAIEHVAGCNLQHFFVMNIGYCQIGWMDGKSLKKCGSPKGEHLHGAINQQQVQLDMYRKRAGLDAVLHVKVAATKAGA
jgi:hypothetical protein